MTSNNGVCAIHPIACRTQHFVTSAELLSYVSERSHLWTAGDKQGISHCSLPKEWVRGQIVTLQPNERYEAQVTFTARKGVSENPRAEVRINAIPDAVESADCILYSNEMLGKDASSEAIYEIIAIRGLTATPNPRPLNTLLHNIFNLSGGTPVEGTDAEKLEMIRESFLFWKDKAMAL
jgi:hypothetical protein